MKHSNAVLIVATMDTKNMEAIFIKERLEGIGIEVLIMDAGIKGNSPVQVDISRHDVAGASGRTIEKVQDIGHEGEALDVMIQGAVKCARDLYRQERITGVLGIGGSMGTTLGSAVMRSFPVGFPKVMISTMASRDTRAFVGTKDILMLHSVCDISGINRITEKVLHNGAMAMAGMVQHKLSATPSEKPLVFISTLGTTEACVKRLKKHLEDKGKEVVVFHTVGAGGRAMEEMISEEDVAAVVDLSLHEIADNLFGGDYDAGPDRGEIALHKGVPCILVPGNIDFLVTGPLKEARRRFPDRPYHKHNAAITVLRTNRMEMEILAQRFAFLVKSAEGPVSVLVPMGGFSAFDSKDGPLYDPEAPVIFSEALENALPVGAPMEKLPYHVNDEEFSVALLRTLESVMDAG